MALKISEEAKVQMPMKTVASLIAMVAIGTWAYFGLHETLNSHSTKIELIEKDLDQNTEAQAETEIYMGQKSIKKIILE
jgi:hypothetical protein